MTSVAQLKTYISNDLNILLQGQHGVGKTEMLRQACEDLDLRVKYFSASTLDPFTDLVGIPVPKEVNGADVLTNVRPHAIDDAEVLFFDELNRAEQKTLNAVFEIVQFHTINDEPLPNLKCVIGAQNPPDGDYTVNSLDPALVDRFHIVLDVHSKPSQSYLSTKFGPDIAAALVGWHRERQKKSDYISPRRLETIGNVFTKLPNNKEAIKATMPPGGAFDYGRLFELLQAATGGGGASAIDYGTQEHAYIRSQALPTSIATWFEEANAEGRANVVDALRSDVGVNKLGDNWEPVLAKFTDKEFERLVKDWGPAKQSSMRAKARNLASTNPELSEAILTSLPLKNQA